ncbi:MAG: iron-containing alcohol dehydrogenase [Clostridia bacterium]|nr:iron-containing alcohol dehydrogenase [Clostridia bacterium]
MEYNHFMPTRVISKKDVVRDFDFSKLGNRAILVTGKTGAVKSGALADVTERLEACGIEYCIFNEIEENPSIESCVKAADAARSFGADVMIAIGGGSAMDAAKAAAVFATNDFADPYEIYVSIPRRALPLVVVGTTSGTGSEVTAVSVITASGKDGERFKKSLKSPRIYPLYALVDPKYTYKLPWNITLSTALDVVSHAIESLYSPKAGEISLIYAYEGLKRAWSAIKKAHWQTFVEFRDITPDVRDELSCASIIAGMAINLTGTGFAHAISYPLSVNKYVPHGLACAYSLVPYLKHNRGEDERRDKMFEQAVGYSFEEFYEDMQKLLPDAPSLSYAEIDSFTELTATSASLKNSISPLSGTGVEKLYLAMHK